MTASDIAGEPSANSGSSPPPQAPVKPAGRWIRIALAVSLALNLAIAGIVAGAMLHGGGPLQAKMMSGDIGFGPFTEALSKDERAQLRGAFIVAVPDFRDARLAVRADFKDLLSQLRAVPFDADALRATFDSQATRNLDRLKLGQHLIFNLLIGMTDDARQAFAGRLEETLARGPKHRDGRANP